MGLATDTNEDLSPLCNEEVFVRESPGQPVGLAKLIGCLLHITLVRLTGCHGDAALSVKVLVQALLDITQMITISDRI